LAAILWITLTSPSEHGSSAPLGPETSVSLSLSIWDRDLLLSNRSPQIATQDLIPGRRYQGTGSWGMECSLVAPLLQEGISPLPQVRQAPALLRAVSPPGAVPHFPTWVPGHQSPCLAPSPQFLRQSPRPEPTLDVPRPCPSCRQVPAASLRPALQTPASRAQLREFSARTILF
jgi:hypothetical protein